MPLIEPDGLREKILLFGGAGASKTTSWLSIAWWAFQSSDKRRFFVADTDDEAVLQVMNEDRYSGMVHSINGVVVNEGGNVHIYSTATWPEMEAFRDTVMKDAVKGDWIVFDFITEFWAAAQDGFLRDAVNKSRGEVLYDSGVAGNSGWEMFKTDFNWNAINGSYFGVVKTILVQNRAHIFMVAEEGMIDERNAKGDDKEHLAQFGKFKAVGQKKLAYQCRSYLRSQRLARGWVLHTNGKDRARTWFNGDTITPDFFTLYLKNTAKWSIAE